MKQGKKYVTGTSARLRGNVWNYCLRSGGGGLIDGGLGTSFVSVQGNKLGVSEGYVGGNMFGLSEDDTCVVVLVKGDVM